MTSSAIGRRAVLKCMAWAGTGALWTVAGGIPRSFALGDAAGAQAAENASLAFVQISDSHIGFNKEANPDVAATLRLALDRINALDPQPAFVLHTGDVTHLSKPAEFAIAQDMLSTLRAPVHVIPGEHDVIGDDAAAAFNARFGSSDARRGSGWYSFDAAGVHFVGLVNVLDLQSSGRGRLGAEQLAWLKDDLAARTASTPIVVFAHMPLWDVYAAWGWGTDDSAEALSHLRRFGSVTVLNGHIHQVQQAVEGNVRFYTAMSTAYPQPAPGAAPAPGPLNVAADRLKTMIGMREVRVEQRTGPVAVTDEPLAKSA